MAKRFAGFTPEQMGKIIPEMQGMQADEQAKFLASQPGAAARVGKMAELAQKRIGMAAGGMAKKQGYNQGGLPEKGTAAWNKQTYDPVSGKNLTPFQLSNRQKNFPEQYGVATTTPNTTGGFDMGAGQQGPTYTTGQEVFQPGYNDDVSYKPVMPRQPVELPSLYSGDITNQTLQDIMKMTTGASPVDLQYDFNKDGKITSDDALQAGKVGVGRGTVSQGTDAGGFYDPSQGLPTAPENIYTDSASAIDAAFEEPKWNEGTTGVNLNLEADKTWAKSTVDTNVANTTIKENPDNYTLVKKGSFYSIVYPDGTSIDTRHRNINYAQGRANALSASFKAAGSIGTQEQVDAAAAQYQQQLDQYKTYSAEQATVSPEQTRANLDTAQSNLSTEQNLLQQYTTQLANMAADDPQRDVIQGLIDEQQVKVTNAKAALSQAQTNVERVGMPSTTEMRATTLEDPMSMVTKADVVTVSDEQRAAGKMAEGTGQADETAEQATVTTADTAPDVVAPKAKAAATYDATTITDKAKAELERAKAATAAGLSAGSTFLGEQGVVSEDALASEVNTVAENRINKVNENVNLEVTKQQLAEAKGKNLKAIEANIAQSDALLEAVAATSQVQPEELPSAALIAEDQMAQAKAITDAGLSPEANPVAAKLAKFSVDNGTLALAMEGEVKALATVEGQLSQLMKDFDDGTPAWAAGAMRAANAVMASRGLGASSMASAAILQAAMESALPIAQQDANTFAQMGMQNLNNRQQVALSNAAAQQGLALQNLNNEQQANLQRSAQAFSLQETNLSNRQSAEIANAQIRATLQGQNLSNQQQSNIAVAARYAEQANINLNNKQQASMQNNANQLQINLANLSSKSQAYITNANLAASLQAQVLSNEQQVSIQNAARYADAANITFTAQQQNALHNSKMMQTIGLAELDANMAATLQNAATYAGMDMANLNNRQQAAAQNAKAFLELDMTNLNNEQQMAMFKAQATQQALLSDQAAENAAKQFNAASENQTNQFYDNLTTQVALQNQEQTNAMNRFNAGEANAIEQFNAAQQNARDQFNANNALVVEQANAQWEQAITTMDNAAQNQSNRDAAQQANSLTETTYNNILQQERDALDYAWRSAESALTRENNLLVSEIQRDSAAATAKGSAAGSIAAVAADYLLKKTFGAIG